MSPRTDPTKRHQHNRKPRQHIPRLQGRKPRQYQRCTHQDLRCQRPHL